MSAWSAREWVNNMIDKKERVYGAWAGNPRGNSEDKSLCVEEVWPSDGRGMIPYQCNRKRGYGRDGLYCKQHAKKHGARGNG